MYEKKIHWIYSLLAILFLLALFAVIYYGIFTMDYEWNYSFLWPFFWNHQAMTPGPILLGLWGTFYISFLSIVFGIVLGIIVGLLLLSREPISRYGATIYVDLFRNTPVLVQLYVAYFIIGTAFDLSAEQAGVLTLAMFCSAYVAEIFRGTISEFERGQIEAAKSMGLTPWAIARHVIAPIALRRMLPPLVGLFVSLVKDSSLVSVISVNELTKSAMNVVSVSFKSFETWFVIALIYLLLNTVLSTFGRSLEKKLGTGIRRGA